MGIRSCFLATLSAFLLVLSFPPFDLYPLMWVGLVPLLFAMEKKRSIESAAIVFAGMLIFFLDSVHWLSIFGWYAWVGSAIYLALFPAVWGFLISPCLRSGKVSFLGILFPPLAFVAMEAVRNVGPWGMPWGDLAYSQSPFKAIIQISSLTGALGLSFLIVLVNLLLFHTLRRKAWKYAAIALVFFLIPFFWGELRLHQTFPKSIKVALIQTNDTQISKWDLTHYKEMLAELDTLVKQAKLERPSLILFPETALAGFLAKDEQLQKLVKSWASETGAYLAVGTLLESEGKPQNAIVLVDSSGLWKQRYAKVRLVPFGEYLPALLRPLRGTWHAFDPIVDFKPGGEFTLFEFSVLRFGTMICFESSFGWIARTLVQHGADFLAVSTNDAWFFQTPAQEMHAIMAIFRSVETGRSAVQAGNTGISMIADPLGRVLRWQGPNQSTIVVGEVPLNSKITLYDRIGDVFACSCIFLTLLIVTTQRRGEVGHEA